MTETELHDLRIDRGPSARKRRRTRPRWVKWLIALAVVALVGFLMRDQLATLALPAVEVERVGEKSPGAVAAATGASANGYVVARTRAALSADTPGRIVELNVTEGSVVKRGDVVARLYSDEYAAALRRAEADLVAQVKSVERAAAEVEATRRELDTLRANVAAARATIDQTKASLHLAQVTFERAQSLVASGVDTLDRRDRAERDLLDAQALTQVVAARLAAAETGLVHGEARLAAIEAGVPEARARVESAAAARDLARATLDKTEVRAPFDGVVVLKDAEVGEVVSPNSQGGSNARGSIVTMVDFATLEVQAEVPETSIAGVAVGAPARIYLDAWPEEAYAGRVDRIWPTANRTKATVEVRVQFIERDGRLRPEMGVRVVFAARAGTDAAAGADAAASGFALPPEAKILLPRAAVVAVDGKSGVFVVERDAESGADVVRWRPVTIGDERAGKVAILAGLESGLEVVREPAASLKDGDRVRVERPQG